MSVTLGFRRVADSDPYIAQLATVRIPRPCAESADSWLASHVCHVDVSVSVKCGQECRYCAGGSRGVHVLSFSTTAKSGRDTVTRCVDRNYGPQDEANPEWLFYKRSVGVGVSTSILMYLNAQIGIPFNRWGMACNFIRVPLTRYQPFKCGTRFQEGGYQTQLATSWLCSELAVAATQRLGVCAGRDPCSVSPSELCLSVIQNSKFIAVTKPGIQTGTNHSLSLPVPTRESESIEICIDSLYSHNQ